MIRIIAACCLCVSFLLPAAAAPVYDRIYYPHIKNVKFYTSGNELALPMISLNGNESLNLQFDDLQADVKYYYYSYQLCDAAWEPVAASPFDYIKGFTQSRISNYRFSSIAYTRYTHYGTTLPEQNSRLTRSGNYILKVYLDGDTSKLAFTRRFMVVNSLSTVLAKITQPFAPEYFRTHQKVQFVVDVKGINNFNAPQQLKVVVLQNYRWDNAATNLKPAFIRGSTLEFNSELSGIFPGGKEWRWLDIRDFKLQSDRVLSADYNKTSTEIYLRPDMALSDERYIYYADLNGRYITEAIRGINPFWEADYATVHFSFVPPGNAPLPDEDVYLYGQLTDYQLTDSIKMKFNAEAGMYETKLFLKQGYYDYTYLAVDRQDATRRREMDGNYYETENVYTILVYYRSFTSRFDELIGAATLNSRTDRPGLSF